MQKRGQVTVFIVVGIVVLVVIGLLLFLRSNIVKTDFESEMNSLTVPKQLEPVKTYIDACLSQTVQDGVFLLGEQGGYINLPEDYTPRSVTNPFSNTLEIYPGAEVAYWYYETPNKLQVQNVPTKEQMEYELESYINENFKDCFYYTATFEDQGFEITDPTSTKAEVTINDNNIQVKVSADVFVSLKEVSKDITTHMVVVNSRLGSLYDLAKQVMEKENENTFLEEKTIDMMVVYEDLPYSETEFTCERKVWQKSQVVEDMKQIVSKNIAAITLKPISSSSFIQPYPDYFQIDVLKQPYINEQFQYFTSWPMQVDVTPTTGDLLVGDPLTQSIPEISKYLNLFFCLNNYHFVYDITYPVLISLSDDTGFTFQFGTLVNIDNNNPRKFEGEVISYDDSTEFTDNFCNNKVKPAEVKLYDYENLNPISGASILYKCFTATCYIGETNPSGELVANFPPCLNGQIIAQKQGYEMSTDTFSTNSEESISLLADKHYDLNLEIRSVNIDDGSSSQIGDRQAVVQFENQDDGYITLVTNEESTITLTNGRYKITSYLMTEADTEIKLDTGTFIQCTEVPKAGILGLFAKDEKCFETEVEGGTLTDVMIGGAVFDWDANALSQYNKLTIYVPYDKVPRTQTEMIDVFGNVQTNNQNINFRYPELQ